MEPGFNFGGDLQLLAYLVTGVGTLVVAVPVGLLVIRRLNETWLDPEWRKARRQRQRNSIESIIVAKSDPIVSSCLWVLLIEIGFIVAGAGLGAAVYLPGPLDGWLVFSMMLFGAGGALLGLFVNCIVLLVRGSESIGCEEQTHYIKKAE